MSRCCRFFVPPVSKISNVSVAREIDPVSRPEIDLVFQHALADGFYVGEIALLHPGDAAGNLGALPGPNPRTIQRTVGGHPRLRNNEFRA